MPSIKGKIVVLVVFNLPFKFDDKILVGEVVSGTSSNKIIAV
jgi:hypothetical protein